MVLMVLVPGLPAIVAEVDSTVTGYQVTSQRPLDIVTAPRAYFGVRFQPGFVRLLTLSDLQPFLLLLA